jgi:hypothetical protein
MTILTPVDILGKNSALNCSYVLVISINGSHAFPPLKKISYFYGGYFQIKSILPTVLMPPNILKIKLLRTLSIHFILHHQHLTTILLEMSQQHLMVNGDSKH